MTIQTLPSSPLPDDQPELNNEPKINRAMFQGYSQRVGQGINNIERTITLNWTNITEYEADVLYNFCVEHSDGRVFYWTPNGMSQLKWSLTRFRRKIRGAGFSGFTLEMRQEYDP